MCLMFYAGQSGRKYYKTRAQVPQVIRLIYSFEDRPPKSTLQPLYTNAAEMVVYNIHLF